MIKGAVVQKIVIEVKEGKGVPGLPPFYITVEAEYDLVNEHGKPTGAKGKYELAPKEARDVVRDMMETMKRSIEEDLLGVVAQETSEKKRLVPLEKDEL